MTEAEAGKLALRVDKILPMVLRADDVVNALEAWTQDFKRLLAVQVRRDKERLETRALIRKAKKS